MGQLENRFAVVIGVVAKVGGRGLGYALGGPLGFEIGGVIVDALVDATDAELASLEVKVDRLIGMHYRAGHKWLLEAKHQPHRSVREKYIENALGAFVNAVSVEDLPINAARAESYVGVCHGLLGRPDLSNFEASYSRLIAIQNSYSPFHFNCAEIKLDVFTGMTRRGALEYILAVLRPDDNRAGVAYPNSLYIQLKALSTLLINRKSKLSGLRAPGSFNELGYAQWSIDQEEKRCNVKYPPPYDAPGSGR